MLSRILEGRGSREIDRKSEIFGLAFLGIGVTFARFQEFGVLLNIEYYLSNKPTFPYESSIAIIIDNTSP